MATKNCTLLFGLALLALPCSADTIGFTVGMPQTVQPTGKHAEWTRSIQRFDPNLGALNSVTFELSLSAYLQFDVISRSFDGILSTVHPNSVAEFMGVVQTNNRTGNALGSSMPCGVPPSQFVPNPLPTCPSVISLNVIELGYFHGVVTSQSANVISTRSGLRIDAPTWLTPPLLSDFIGDSPMTLMMQLDPSPWGGGNDVYGDLKPLLMAGIFYPATTGSFSISYNYTPTPFVVSAETPEPRYVGILLGAMLLGGLTLKRRSWHHV